MLHFCGGEAGSFVGSFIYSSMSVVFFLDFLLPPAGASPVFFWCTMKRV